MRGGTGRHGMLGSGCDRMGASGRRSLNMFHVCSLPACHSCGAVCCRCPLRAVCSVGCGCAVLQPATSVPVGSYIPVRLSPTLT